MIDKMHVSSKCPKCHGARVVTFLRLELWGLISARRPINCMCAACNEIWPITPVERIAVERDIAAQGVTLDAQDTATPSSSGSNERDQERVSMLKEDPVSE